MVEDLDGHHLRRGMSRREIARLLGRSDDRDQTRRSLSWSYEIGGPLTLLSECGNLTIRFDSKGRVTAWERASEDD
jgi:hypothetical protein